MANMRNAGERLGVTASTESPTRIIIWRPFAVYLVWADGDKKLVCLCPDESMPDLVAMALSLTYADSQGQQIPIENKNSH